MYNIIPASIWAISELKAEQVDVWSQASTSCRQYLSLIATEKCCFPKKRVQITSRKLHFSAYIGASKVGLYVSTKALLK